MLRRGAAPYISFTNFFRANFPKIVYLKTYISKVVWNTNFYKLSPQKLLKDTIFNLKLEDLEKYKICSCEKCEFQEQYNIISRNQCPNLNTRSFQLT
jgi:hypothetical protein